jgi:hypothetical protein
MKNAIAALVRKKTLFALVLALTIFGAVYGFAATLNVGNGQLSAGNASVASCQVAGATGTYAVAYDTTIPGYKVSTVNVNAIDAACATKSLSVTLTGAANANLITLTGTVPAGGGSLALTTGASVISAAAVTGLSLAING